MPFLSGGWADATDAHLPPTRPYELIMGSDVLYERDEAGVLPHFIARHASAAGEVMIIDPNRGNRSAFHRRMATLGYALTETIIKDPLGPGGPYRGRMLHYRRH
jgi:predicted nicotinamide N-methyase